MYDELVKKLNKLTDDDSRHDYGVGHYWNACEEALDAIEDLQARVAELEEAIQFKDKDIDRLFKMNDEERIKTENVEQRLRDVMIEACNRPLDVTVAIARAAGHVRCECGGSGKLKFTNVENADDEYYEPCPCVVNGTTGWREANDE